MRVIQHTYAYIYMTEKRAAAVPGDFPLQQREVRRTCESRFATLPVSAPMTHRRSGIQTALLMRCILVLNMTARDNYPRVESRMKQR
jgi:hypothetical protein